MKKFLPLLALFPALLFAQNTAWYTNNTDAETFYISTADELRGLAVLVNGGTSTFENKTILLKDYITLNDTTNWNGWNNGWNENTTGLNQWTAIGTSSRPFKGTFDGNGKVIAGIYGNQGLFGSNSGTIKNIGVEAFYIKGSGIGGLVGNNSGNISESCVTGSRLEMYNVSSLAGGTHVGGLVGSNSGNISNSCAIGSVSGSDYVGGLVGYNSGTISNSYAAVDVSNLNLYGGSPFFGGLVGANYGYGGVVSGNYWGGEYWISDYHRGTLNGSGGGSPIGNNNTTFVGWDFETIWISYGSLLVLSPISNAQVATIEDQEYFGSQIKPEPEVKVKGITLTTTNHFNYEYGTNLNVGTGTVTIVGKTGKDFRYNEYFGRQTVTFNIIKNTDPNPPFAQTDELTVTYNPTLTLADITLPDEYEWENSSTQVNAGDGQEFEAYYQNPNCVNKSVGKITVNVAKANGTATFANITDLVYDGTPKTPTVTSTTNPVTPTFTYSGTSYGGASYNSAEPPTNAGYYTLTATFPASDNYNSFSKTATFAISRAKGTCSVTMKDFTASDSPSIPVPVSPTNSTGSVTYSYEGINNDYVGSNIPANAGTYRVETTFAATANYNVCTATNTFTIYPGSTEIVQVTWEPPCGHEFTYTGELRYPEPYSAYGDLKVTGQQRNAGSHTATAQLFSPNANVVLQPATCPYTIKPKDLPVSWAEESIFTYNKMVPPLDPTVSEPNIPLKLNAYVNAGKYSGATAADVYITDQAMARNYNLTNNTKNYEIEKKDLKSHITTPSTLTDFESDANTVRVPLEIFNDKDALIKILGEFVAYEGFATDGQGKSDDATVLTGKPTIEINYSQNSQLSKRVETSQQAIAVINTNTVSANNYTPLSRSITVISTVEDGTDATQAYCLRGNICTALCEEACSILGGSIKASCDDMVACLIEGLNGKSVCSPNMSRNECSKNQGTPYNTCEEASPILNRENPPIGAIGVQTTYYNLKGEPLGATKPTTPGVYIEKSGSMARKVLAK